MSRLLQGENIDFYLAMSLDGISVLNDLAGGVTVTLEDDFSAADPAMTKGTTLTLQGDQAGDFCAQAHGYWRRHQRSPHGAAGGVSCTAFRTAGKQGAAGSAVHRTGVRCAAALSLVTDLAKGQLVNEVWAAKDDTVVPCHCTEGEHKVAEDGFTEFYPTEASIQKAVLTLFWEPVEE